MTQRKSPAPPQHRAFRNSITSETDSTAYRPEDGYAAPAADERHEQRLLNELWALGYRITVPCNVCGHALSTERSVGAHIGPKCAAKAVR
ncbi:DUF6011 domain-containing protein [Mycobacterium sp. OTB74]|jgi:hypothetical protein|uniref:DUF6011 domain-containing protein n=1 Tax=Mycobacterium sp. OTB74 TaxID=1853452 RepID=UPI002473BAD0|nr:DUF6011 domain-containing protein [Mycobacterium sp. OTB74]MDH6247253.1 hypothetical protein [Mycobacterium sp. OTB74]